MGNTPCRTFTKSKAFLAAFPLEGFAGPAPRPKLLPAAHRREAGEDLHVDGADVRTFTNPCGPPQRHSEMGEMGTFRKSPSPKVFGHPLTDPNITPSRPLPVGMIPTLVGSNAPAATRLPAAMAGGITLKPPGWRAGPPRAPAFPPAAHAPSAPRSAAQREDGFRSPPQRDIRLTRCGAPPHLRTTQLAGYPVVFNAKRKSGSTRAPEGTKSPAPRRPQ